MEDYPDPADRHQFVRADAVEHDTIRGGMTRRVHDSVRHDNGFRTSFGHGGGVFSSSDGRCKSKDVFKSAGTDDPGAMSNAVFRSTITKHSSLPRDGLL